MAWRVQRAQAFAPGDVVGGVDGAVEIEIAWHGGHLVRDEDALRTVRETGPEDELAHVVEAARPAIAVSGGRNEVQVAERTEVGGCNLERIAGANEELQIAGPIGRPDAAIIGEIDSIAGHF